MNLNTDHLKRCIETLRSSLTFYEKAATDSIDQEIFRNAIVKGYELAQETSFKLLKKPCVIMATVPKKSTPRLSKISCACLQPMA